MRDFFAKTAAAILAAVLLLPVQANALSARQAVALEPVTGRHLFEREPAARARMASTTKIMTALLICEQCNVLDRMRIPKEAVGIEGSSMYLQEGEVLTLQELLYGLMLSSGNDAAVALAIYCGGTVEGFVARMNDKARTLGLKDTHFANPNGLDAPDHYSSAADLAALGAYAMENPIFAKTVSTKTVQAGGRALRNHNKLLWLLPGAEGIKTGFTKAAGRILVSSAQRQGRRLVAATMDAPTTGGIIRRCWKRGLRIFALCRSSAPGSSWECARSSAGQGRSAWWRARISPLRWRKESSHRLLSAVRTLPMPRWPRVRRQGQPMFCSPEKS